MIAACMHAAAQMAKSGLSLEVDCGELGGRILTALRAERWRGRAECALRSPAKTTGAGAPLTMHGPYFTPHLRIQSGC